MVPCRSGRRASYPICYHPFLLSEQRDILLRLRQKGNLSELTLRIRRQRRRLPWICLYSKLYTDCLQ
ncbi:unnamed protein product [Cuscuta campestris]|uniref:Uncharacterized protein n=1 Tax=Cuscuta campestris TaxID=132261 RepID=A0A484KEZ7_9ASTE|nr:unnamed protein product [Cuscuta campestris]